MTKNKSSDKPLFIKYFQFFMIPLAKLVLSPFIKAKQIKLKAEDLDKSKKYIIVCNHISYIDPFAVCYSFPFSIHRKLGPYRFLIVNRMFNYWWLRPWLFAFGGYPAKKHHKYEYGIPKSIDILSQGQTLMVFPEGRITKYDREHPPKPGIEILSKLDGAMIIPARVGWKKSNKLFKNFLLVVDKPINPKGMSAKQIMDIVYNLKLS